MNLRSCIYLRAKVIIRVLTFLILFNYIRRNFTCLASVIYYCLIILFEITIDPNNKWNKNIIKEFRIKPAVKDITIGLFSFEDM